MKKIVDNGSSYCPKQNYFNDIVVNDKKGVLGILKIYGNFRKRTPDELYHLEQTPG